MKDKVIYNKPLGPLQKLKRLKAIADYLKNTLVIDFTILLQVTLSRYVRVWIQDSKLFDRLTC